MNLENIKAIINSGFENWERLLLVEIANDPKAVTHVLYMLDAERSQSKALVTDLNALLSKAHLGLEDPIFNKGAFMQKEITEFYKSGRIGHCFKQIK